MSLQVLKPGPLSTLQDRGRYGYQRFGVVASGAMDEWSHRVANLLAGNRDDEATLEITLMGPRIRFDESTLIAICGADLSPRIAGEPLPLETPVRVPVGAQVDFGSRKTGCRAYLAVQGGFRVPPVMGSRSTFLRGGFGGFEGRALRSGDVLEVGEGSVSRFSHSFRRLSCGADLMLSSPTASVHPMTRSAATPRPIRVIEGSQWDAFTDEARATFLHSDFRINPQSDRMGFRLDGPALTLGAPLEMISEAVAFGTIQVPPDGRPIVLMADRQTTGGYPKIADVASVDLPLLAQLLPNEPLRFERVSLEEAQALWLEREREIERMAQAIDDAAQGR